MILPQQAQPVNRDCHKRGLQHELGIMPQQFSEAVIRKFQYLKALRGVRTRQQALREMIGESLLPFNFSDSWDIVCRDLEDQCVRARCGDPVGTGDPIYLQCRNQVSRPGGTCDYCKDPLPSGLR